MRGQTVRRDGLWRRRLSATNRAALPFVSFVAASSSQTKPATLLKNSEVGGSAVLAVVDRVVQFKESGVYQGRLRFRFLPPVFLVVRQSTR
jgi:hypothetical protein